MHAQGRRRTWWRLVGGREGKDPVGAKGRNGVGASRCESSGNAVTVTADAFVDVVAPVDEGMQGVE